MLISGLELGKPFVFSNDVRRPEYRRPIQVKMTETRFSLDDRSYPCQDFPDHKIKTIRVK